MSDNRLAAGGCFVGRDVHSNPMKDVDGAETPSHLNAVGTWLADNVFYNQDGAAGISGTPTRGLWCTNCHTQLGQEMWQAEDCNNLINGRLPGQPARCFHAGGGGLGGGREPGNRRSPGWIRTTTTRWVIYRCYWQPYDRLGPGITDANVATIEVTPGWFAGCDVGCGW